MNPYETDVRHEMVAATHKAAHPRTKRTAVIMDRSVRTIQKFQA